jgi:uncharacterized protein
MYKIEITRPSENQLKQIGIAEWSPWECELSEFDWIYDKEEWCFIFEGRAEIRTETKELVEIKAGDLVKFPKGLRCRWKVLDRIRKVYVFM